MSKITAGTLSLSAAFSSPLSLLLTHLRLLAQNESHQSATRHQNVDQYSLWVSESSSGSSLLPLSSNMESLKIFCPSLHPLQPPLQSSTYETTPPPSRRSTGHQQGVWRACVRACGHGGKNTLWTAPPPPHPSIIACTSSHMFAHSVLDSRPRRLCAGADLSLHQDVCNVSGACNSFIVGETRSGALMGGEQTR